MDESRAPGSGPAANKPANPALSALADAGVVLLPAASKAKLRSPACASRTGRLPASSTKSAATEVDKAIYLEASAQQGFLPVLARGFSAIAFSRASAFGHVFCMYASKSGVTSISTTTFVELPTLEKV